MSKNVTWPKVIQNSSIVIQRRVLWQKCYKVKGCNKHNWPECRWKRERKEITQGNVRAPLSMTEFQSVRRLTMRSRWTSIWCTLKLNVMLRMTSIALSGSVISSHVKSPQEFCQMDQSRFTTIVRSTYTLNRDSFLLLLRSYSQNLKAFSTKNLLFTLQPFEYVFTLLLIVYILTYCTQRYDLLVHPTEHNQL